MTSKSQKPKQAELSRLFDLQELRKNDSITIDLRANDAECSAVG
jgi:hypothetical protein